MPIFLTLKHFGEKTFSLLSRNRDLVVLDDKLPSEVNGVAIRGMAKWEALVGWLIDTLRHLVQNGIDFLLFATANEMTEYHACAIFEEFFLYQVVEMLPDLFRRPADALDDNNASLCIWLEICFPDTCVSFQKPRQRQSAAITWYERGNRNRADGKFMVHFPHFLYALWLQS